MELFTIKYPQEQILGGKKIYVHSITPGLTGQGMI